MEIALKIKGLTNFEVARRWLAQDSMAHGDSRNMHVEGLSLYSYNVLIARWHDDLALVTTKKYSVTTSKHVGLVRAYTPQFIRVPDPTPDHVANLAGFVDQWKATSGKALRSRLYCTDHLEFRTLLKRDLIHYCRHFGLDTPALALPEEVERKLTVKLALMKLNGKEVAL